MVSAFFGHVDVIIGQHDASDSESAITWRHEMPELAHTVFLEYSIGMYKAMEWLRDDDFMEGEACPTKKSVGCTLRTELETKHGS
jgi:hypothetical protein